MQRSVHWRIIIGSNMQSSVPYHARLCSFSCRHWFTHVMIRSRACYRPFRNTVAPVPTSLATKESIRSFAGRHRFDHATIRSFVWGMIVPQSLKSAYGFTQRTWTGNKHWYFFKNPCFYFRIHISNPLTCMRSFPALAIFQIVINDFVHSVVMQGCVTSIRTLKCISTKR